MTFNSLLSQQNGLGFFHLICQLRYASMREKKKEIFFRIFDSIKKIEIIRIKGWPSFLLILALYVTSFFVFHTKVTVNI